MERRSFVFDDIEVREDGDSGAPVLRGYVARFNVVSANLGGFVERIQPGAFSKTVGEADIPLLLNHDPNIVLGRNTAGTLDIRERSAGLWIENQMPDTQQARDILVSVKRGDITQGSFSFRTVNDDWDEEAEPLLRTLQEAKLLDVSLVTFPAYPGTSVGARFSAAAEALAVAEDGQELNRAELRALTTHVEELRQYLPPEPHSDDSEPHSDGGDSGTLPQVVEQQSRLRSRWLDLARR